MNEMNQLYTTLNNGVEMPLLGLGVYDMDKKETLRSVSFALETGYRLIDTATMYDNEREVGQAVKNSKIERDKVFVTTKVNNPDQGYSQTLRAFDRSMTLLDLDYIDLYLIHWPIRQTRKETWKALEEIYKSRKVKAIGVANYLLPFINELKGYASIVPAVNQVEFSPFLYLKDLLTICQKRGIQLQSYTPLTRGRKLNDPRLIRIAEKHNKSTAQVILRWNVQHQVSTIPKSANEQRIKENFDIWDFFLDEDAMKELDSMHQDLRLVGDPASML